MKAQIVGEPDKYCGKTVLSFTTSEQAVSTFMYIYSYTQNLELLYQTPEELSIEVSIPTFARAIVAETKQEERRIVGAIRVILEPGGQQRRVCGRSV